MIASLAVTGISAAAMSWVLEQLGLDGSTVASVLLRIAGYALAVAVDMAIFTFMFTRLPKVASPMRTILKGALFGAIGFEILKTAGSLLVKSATSNPVYGIFAVVVGLLIWLNYLSRFTLFVAAWTVTAPQDSDVRPSGTADTEIAEQAGIPPEYASTDPDDVATTAGDGAPSPLVAAMAAKPDDNAPDTADDNALIAAPTAAAVVAPNGAHPASPGVEKARAAGYIGVGMVAAGTMGVAWKAVRATGDLLRESVRRR